MATKKTNARTNNTASKNNAPSAWDRMKATGSAVAEHNATKVVVGAGLGAVLIGAVSAVAVNTYEALSFQ